MMRDKTRLTRISSREIESHKSTGFWWGPGIVPRELTTELLLGYGLSREAVTAIVEQSVDPLGRFRMDENFREKRLAQAEIVAQAKTTGALAAELQTRIQNMDPYLKAAAVGKAFSTWGEVAFPENLQDSLTRLSVLMPYIASELEKIPSKVPKRTGARNRLLAQVTEILAANSPGATKTRNREIAVSLLGAWGVDAPQDDNKVRKAIRGTK